MTCLEEIKELISGLKNLSDFGKSTSILNLEMTEEKLSWLVKMVERQGELIPEMFGIIDGTLWPSGFTKWVDDARALLAELEGK